jgi:hypothetical protein
MRESQIRLLALSADYTDQLSYFDDWSDALQTYPEFDTTIVNIAAADAGRRINAALAHSDGIVLLHSTNGDTTIHLERHVAALSARRCPLVSFVGNEVNLPGSPIAGKRKVLGKIRPDWIATQLLQESGQFLFGDIAARGVVSIPHALNPKVFWPTSDPDARPIDIGTRVARYLPHLGDDDRNRIADRFIQLGNEGKLTVDISNRRFDRADWADFLNRCKGTVSSEAGSWYLERDDATVNAIRDFTRKQSRGVEIANDSALLRIGYRSPRWLRRAAARVFSALGGRYEYQTIAEPHHDADIQTQFFSGKARPAFYGKCISSRHFDAAGTKTCQIMFRGRFNDILEADRHYLAVDHDFANLDDVLRRFADAGERRVIVERTYDHVMAGHTYAHRMHQLGGLLRSAA